MVDVDENTLVTTSDEDLAEIRRGMKEYKDYAEADSDTSHMSYELKSLMRHMHSYASRYNVDLYRSLKENGGRHTADGDGAMSKVKFQSVLLSAFQRMTTMFKSNLLEELTALYGTGPKETGEVRTKKSFAATSKPGADGNAGNKEHGFLEVKWIRFVNDVGERYLTFPPRGHGNELGLDAVDDLKSEILLKGDNDGDGFETHEMYQSDVHRRNDDAAYWESKNAPTTGFKGTSGFGLGAGNIHKSGAHLADTVFEGVDATTTQNMRARSDI